MPPPAELFASRAFLGPALRAQPDRRLVDLVRDGYDAAFEEIVRRYRKQLHRFAAGIVGGGAEDVTQDAFSKALLALRGSEAEIELRPWLYRIVRNTALNDLRDRAPAAAELSELLPGGRSAAAEAEAREELRDLMERLGALPEPQRAALVMRELEGLSHEEIAAALGVSGGAARQAIYRARAALREGLGFLVPLPVFRMLAANGAEMVKAGAATVLIAGTVGAGVAIQHHHGHKSGPEAAEAAPLVAGKHGSAEASRASGQSNAPSGNDERRGGRDGGDREDSRGHGGSDERGSSLGSGIRSGSSSGPGPASEGSPSGGSSDHPGDDGSHHSGSSGPGSGSGSDDSGPGSGDRHSGSGSDDGGGSHSGSGSGDDGGGTSGGSGGDDGLTSGDGGGSGSGSDGGGVETEPISEPTLSESSSDGGGSSDDSSSESGGPGSGSSGGSDDSLSSSSSTSDGSS